MKVPSADYVRGFADGAIGFAEAQAEAMRSLRDEVERTLSRDAALSKAQVMGIFVTLARSTDEALAQIQTIKDEHGF